MKRFLLFLALLVCVTASAQSRRAGFFKNPVVESVASYNPTNIAGVTNLSWWVAEGQNQTNASGLLSNWVDAGVSPRNLTNTASSPLWPRMTNGIVNGLAAVHFLGPSSATYLRNLAYTSSQPHEVTMVLRWVAPTNNVYPTVFDSANSGNRNGLYQNDTGKFQMVAGSGAGNVAFTTNKWLVVSALFNGTSSGIWVNNISGGALNAGTQTDNGFTLGTTYTLGSGSPIQVAEIITGTSLGAVDTVGVYSVATLRSNRYVYLTNKYAIAQ